MNALRLILLAAAAAAVVLSPGSALARGVLGEEFVEFDFAIIKPGDEFVAEIDDTIMAAGAALNVPVDPRVDVGMSVSYAKIAGNYFWYGWYEFEETQITVELGPTFHFRPEHVADPFLWFSAGIIFWEDEIREMGVLVFDETGEELSLSAGGGVEFDIARWGAIRPSVFYVNVEDYDDYGAALGITLWPNDSFLINFGAEYYGDSEDISYFVGAGFRL